MSFDEVDGRYDEVLRSITIVITENSRGVAPTYFVGIVPNKVIIGLVNKVWSNREIDIQMEISDVPKIC